MKNVFAIISLAGIIVSYSCTKEYHDVPNQNSNSGNNGSSGGGNTITKYATLGEFYAVNGVKLQNLSVDATTGGVLTTPAGTQLMFYPNTFVTLDDQPVTGDVTIQFKEIYLKSDMLLSDMPTMLTGGAPLKSGGEFWIKAASNGVPVKIAPGYSIMVSQPLNGLPYDVDMDAFVAEPNGNWIPASNAQVMDTGTNYTSYLTYIHEFITPEDSGTWVNCDNPSFFSAYTQAELTLHPDFNVTGYFLDMYLIFMDINTVVHIYALNGNFVYSNSPVGLNCTAVAVGIKDSALYSSFTPITIGSNMTVNFNLSPTTDSLFFEQLKALN